MKQEDTSPPVSYYTSADIHGLKQLMESKQNFPYSICKNCNLISSEFLTINISLGHILLRIKSTVSLTYIIRRKTIKI